MRAEEPVGYTEEAKLGRSDLFVRGMGGSCRGDKSDII